MTRMILHYAPDNASAIIRLALVRAGLAFETQLVDRKAQAQQSEAYKRLNPMAQIPTLETPDGPVTETAAILMWIAEQRPDCGLLPAKGPARAQAVRWLVFLSNTLHVDLRQSFYPYHTIGPDPVMQDHLRQEARARVVKHFTLFHDHALPHLSLDGDAIALGLYAGFLFRWAQLYPERGVIDLSMLSQLMSPLYHLETASWLQDSLYEEGLTGAIFTDPHHPNPPYGSAT